MIAGLALQWVDVRTDIALTTVLLVFAVPGAIAASGTRQHTGRGFSLRAPLQALARQRAFVPVTIGLIAITMIWGILGAFLPVFGKEALGLPSTQVGYLLAIQALVNGASRLPGGRLVDRARHRWPIVFIGVLVCSASTVLLGHLTGFLGPAIVIAVGTPFIAITFITIGVVFADLSAASTRGVTMGVYGTILFLGLSVSPLVFGPVVQAYGYAAGFTACAVVSSVLAVVMAALHAEPLRRRSEAPMPPPTPGT
jgi:MFS family permease